MSTHETLKPPAGGLFDPRMVLPAAMLLLLGGLWGLSFSLSKVAAMGGVHPFAYAWMQSTGAAIFLTLVCWHKGIPLEFSRRHLVFFVGAAVIGLVLPNINIITTAKHIPAGVMSTVVSSVPVLGYVLAVGLRIEGFRWACAIGIGLGLVGALMMVVPDTSLPSPDMVPWVLMAFLTPALYAFSGIFSDRMRPDGTHSLAAARGMLIVASLSTLPLMLAVDGFYPLMADPGPTDYAMLGQISISSVAYILYFEILKRAGPVFLSLVSYVVNLFGLGWGWVIFGEVHSAWIWGAVGCVFVSMVLVNLGRKAR
ncbi:DMT family transporter [Nisaea acidiphila]|uniref:DMT family transporter n=1 Tax=Nisaea acidiphila TaxID=1862145 RepID=A0A9J7B0R6_9PROT|nr:DMT family transporter [Nisaea acidiphila]UUX52068.1 DMT family transporter [Nisaea acidiphila]